MHSPLQVSIAPQHRPQHRSLPPPFFCIHPSFRSPHSSTPFRFTQISLSYSPFSWSTSNNFVAEYFAVVYSVSNSSALNVGEELNRVLDERDAKKKEVTIAMSAASTEKVNGILGKLSILESVEEKEETFSTDSTSPSFLTFDWKNRHEDEASAVADAFSHLEEELKKFPIHFGRGGFKLVDVHSKSVLNFEDPKVGKLSGGTDVVMVPYKTANSGVAKQLCVLFELKTANRIEKEGGFSESTAQAKVELLAARCLSNQPNVLLILTDLCTGAMSFWFEYDEKFKSFSLVSSTLSSLSEMGNVVTSFVTDKVVANAGYQALAENESALEKPVLLFKKQKLSPMDDLAMDAFNEMMDFSEDGSRERAQMAAEWFSAIGFERTPSVLRYPLMYT